MRLTTYQSDDATVQAGYQCPCGCTPSVTYQRGGELAANSCCCGNEFVVGPDAQRALAPRAGFELQTEQRAAAWGAPITAAWLVGDSKHPEPISGAHEHDHHDHDGGGDGPAVDPVCGMTVDPGSAVEKGLHREHKGNDYYFCGKGCYLEFGDDPERFLDPSYIPSM